MTNPEPFLSQDCSDDGLKDASFHQEQVEERLDTGAIITAYLKFASIDRVSDQCRRSLEQIPDVLQEFTRIGDESAAFRAGFFLRTLEEFHQTIKPESARAVHALMNIHTSNPLFMDSILKFRWPKEFSTHAFEALERLTGIIADNDKEAATSFLCHMNLLPHGRNEEVVEGIHYPPMPTEEEFLAITNALSDFALRRPKDVTYFVCDGYESLQMSLTHPQSTLSRTQVSTLSTSIIQEVCRLSQEFPEAGPSRINLLFKLASSIAYGHAISGKTDSLIPSIHQTGIWLLGAPFPDYSWFRMDNLFSFTSTELNGTRIKELLNALSSAFPMTCSAEELWQRRECFDELFFDIPGARDDKIALDTALIHLRSINEG